MAAARRRSFRPRPGGWRRHARFQGGIGPLSWACPTVDRHCELYGSAAAWGTGQAAGYIARWRRRRYRQRRRRSPGTCPLGRRGGSGRRTCCGRRASWPIGLGLGLEAVPEVLLHPSVTERFTRCAPGLSGRRGGRCAPICGSSAGGVPQLYPADLPLPRERAKAPYRPAEIGGFLALADAQPTGAADARGGAVCLGAGAGLIRGDLRDVRGTDVRAVRRAVVTVRGARPRAVPSFPAITPGCWRQPGPPGPG